MKGKRSALISIVGFLLFSSSVLAHHGAAGMDMTKVVTMKATITQFEFINPHSLVHFDVKDENTGKVENWVAELGAANALHRDGWNTDTLKPGDHVTISGYQAKNGTYYLRLYEILTSDGKRLGRSDGR